MILEFNIIKHCTIIATEARIVLGNSWMNTEKWNILILFNDLNVFTCCSVNRETTRKLHSVVA